MTLTQEESLALITSMINKAKCEFEETGISALMWGIIVFVCAMISFLNYYTHWRWADYIWFLTLIAVIPQIIISIRENKRKRFKSHNEAALGSIWISFGISIFLFSYFANVYNVAHAESALSAAEYSINAAIAWPGRRIWSGKSSTRGNGRTL